MEDNAYLYLKPQSVRQQFDPKFEANPRNKSMSCSNFLLKFLVIALFLCLIPLFPSEPPEFISETVFAKSWELIHLLVIGIALSYGLFCRRKNPEQVSPKSVNFQQYKQNAVQHSSIFDCVDENPSVKFDKKSVEDKSCDFSGFRTEPYVVVRQRSGENVEERFLGLPVRSLRSRVVDSDSEDECVSEGESDCSGESSCSESSSCTISEKGEILEGNVESNGFGNGWNSRSVREGFIAGNGVFEVNDGKGENFEGNLGSNGFGNGVKSRSMRASSMAGKSDFEMYAEKGENFEGKMGNNGFSNGVKSRSMRASSMAGNIDFEMYGEKGENFEGNIGNNSFPYGLKSQSMRAGFMAGNGDFELHCGKGENFEGNVGSNVFPNEWNSRSFMAGFMPGFGQNLEGNVNVEVSAPPNGCESRFMAGNGDNFVGNVGSNAFPYGWDSRSMKTGYTAESAKGENLEENLGNSSQVSWKSRSMRSNFMVNNGTVEPELLKSRSFRSPIQGGASCGINAGVCSWLPESPNMVEGYPWNGVNNMPFPNFHTQVDSSDLVGSAPTSEKCNTTSNFYMPSTATPPSVPVSTSDFASGSRMHDYENGSWGTPTILENANTFVGNSATLMPSEKDLAQPIFSSSPKKNEEYFMPRTPEIPPSILRAPGELASSVGEPRRSKSKLKLSGKKHEKQLEKDIGVEPLVPINGTSVASRIIPPVENVSLPINVTFPKNNEDFFLPVGPNNKNTSVNSDSLLRESPNNGIASTVKAPTWANLSRRTLLKKDSGVRSESNYKTRKDDVIFSSKGSFLNENEKKATPVKWDENCFVIPLSENNDTEDLVEQPAYFSEVASSRSRLSSDEQELEQNGVDDEDVILKESAHLSEVASSRSRTSSDEQESEQNGVQEDVLLKEPAYLSGVASSRSRFSCDEQESEQNGAEEDVQLKDTIDYSEIEVLSREIEAYKPSPPGTPPVESSSKAHSDSFLLVESPKNVKSLSKAPHSRGFSCTSFFDRDLRKSIKNEAREENRMSEGDQYVGKAGKCGCLSLDVRPSLSKAALKGKSVRTIRPREVAPMITNQNAQSDQKKEENSGMVVIKIGISEKRTSSNGRKREKQGGGGTSIIVGVSSKEGSNSKAGVLCDVKEDDPDSEIDKKADEFIAKFKEQIRIEKVTTRGDSSRRQVPLKKSLYQT